MRTSGLGFPGLGGWSDDPLWASVYDWMVEHEQVGGLLWRLGFGSDLRLLYDAAATIGRLPAGSRVLDVPTGGGVALRGLRPGQGLDYVAADISPAMLVRTREAAVERGVSDQVTTTTADVEALPYDDASFDLVVCFTGLHCFPDPRRAVSEMTRVLRPGGRITGSLVLADAGLRYTSVLVGGRLSGLLGPSATARQVRHWLGEDGMSAVRVHRSGALGYYEAVRTAAD